MTDTAQQWDKMIGTTQFDGNAWMVWPKLFAIIEEHFPNKENLRALDFGCWDGKLCCKLAETGFATTGTEIAEKVIEQTKAHSSENIIYHHGGIELFPRLPSFHFISAIMVLQFVQEHEYMIEKFTEKLEPGGIFAMAAFNPQWKEYCVKNKMFFSDFNHPEQPDIGKTEFENGTKITTYIRTPEEYDTVAEKYGLTNICTHLPEYTQEFLDRYNLDEPLPVPIHLVLAYQKR